MVLEMQADAIVCLNVVVAQENMFLSRISAFLSIRSLNEVPSSRGMLVCFASRATGTSILGMMSHLSHCSIGYKLSNHLSLESRCFLHNGL